MIDWSSNRIIGDVDKFYEQHKQRSIAFCATTNDPLWLAYYNGWVAGRLNMLGEMKKEVKE